MNKSNKAPETPENDAYTVFAFQSLQKRVAALEEQMRELTAGDLDDEAVPNDWLEDHIAMLKARGSGSQFISTNHIGMYQDVMREADAEDAAREGHHG